MTYAQARLRLGICGVGWWVLLAWLALSSGYAYRLSLAEIGLLYALASLPLDVLGGQLLPMLWKKPRLKLLRWIGTYLRGVTLHLGLWLSSLGFWSLVYPTLGLGLTMALFWVASLAFFACQLPLLGWLGVRLHRHPWGWEADAADSRFSGGLWGLPLPGREQVVIPSQWLSPDAPVGIELSLERRRKLSQSASRAAGLLMALVFNSLVLSKALEWGQGQPAAMACWATLLSFLGLLILPTFSRPGVFAADQVSPGPDPWWRWLEERQEEDPTRPLWIDRIFHPIPQWSQRQSRWAGPHSGFAPWNLARYALVHSLLCGSMLSRAVHCNCGRPELWFWPPSD